MLGRQACTALSNLARLTLQAEALLETGVLNQPGSRELHVIGVLDTRGERGSLHDHREVRGALRQGIQGRARNDRVGEEGTGGEGVTVLGVEHHTLGAAQLQHLFAYQCGFGALTGLNAQALRQLGVTNRGGQATEGELEINGQHHVAGRAVDGCALEHRVAVAEAQVCAREGLPSVLFAVPGAYGGDELAHLNAVCADVLHGGCTHGAGNAGESRGANPFVLDAELHEVVPDGARLHAHVRAAACGDGQDLYAFGGDVYDGSVEAFVGNQQVGAAAHDEDGFACGVCSGDCFDNFCFGGGADVGLSGAAYLGGGQFAQQLFSHRLRIPVVVRGQHPPRVKVTKTLW